MDNEQFLGIFTFVSAIFGCFTNWSVVIFFRSVPSFHSSFGILSAHGALITAIYCTVALFWIAPVMLLDTPWLKINSHLAGIILYLCYDLATETHLLICLNRFFAVLFPHKYSTLFTINSTIGYLTILWLICSSISFFIFSYSKCQMYYEESLFLLVYTNTPKCQNLFFLADFVLHIGVVIVMIILNSITFYQFRRKNRVVLTTINHASSLRKAKSERNFLKQTFYQESAYIFGLLSYFFLGNLVENEWIRFLIILLPWYFVHAFEGMVTILCNPELKKVCFRKWMWCFVDSTPEPSRVVDAGKSKTSHVSRI